MKKFTRVLCAMFIVAMLASLLCLPASAATVDWSNVKLEALVDMFNGYVETSDELLEDGQYCMRGFAVSPDGRFAFCGLLNPNSSAALNVIDLESARPVSCYVHEQNEGGRAYPKGIAVDDRNYVYVGEAYYPNYGAVNYAILSYNDKGELTEEGFYNAITEGTPGDKNGTKLGVNGVDIAKLDGKYYMYMVINYDWSRLYRFDVTDVKAPKLDTSFGNNGFVDLKSAFNFKDAQYLDVDTDGTIYLGGTTQTDSGLYVLSADGKSLLNTAACTKGYAVALWEDFVLVSTQSGPTCINVFDKVTMNKLATIACHDGANSYVYITVINDVMYVGDQSSGSGDYDSVVVAPLSDAAKKIISDRKAAYAAALETTTPAETTPAPVETTTPKADDTTTPKADDTTPKADETTPAAKDTTTPKADDTTAGKKEGGCGSSVAAGLLLCVIPAAVVVAKKKKD